ncbi:hypothetical protein M501DRAFT_973546 [Patellaria atrata CBS 101060]|uniref:Chitin biosynthesis protein n=1 Tax=Patellaria atrata CBS 101060 TaxID=1346257 RepID=A0A9P4SC04_9PEZI|nr:hypothetical protein M501DRAFT_973546 [Patellaria atrata CBS 101060]
MLVSLTVGKVDAGVAVLLTEDKRLIEFPSILLPPDISSGSIVDITVARNFDSEARTAAAFQSLQNTIYHTFGLRSPSPPVLRCRNATQTSVVLEWDPVELATAELRSLSLYRNGSKAGSIPRPTETLATKISGLAVDTAYTFHLVLRTSAGTYSSEKLTVRTHKMTELSGITITPGIMAAPLRESLVQTVERIGAKIIDTVRIDTTHFVCTEGRGQAWEKAVESNVPVVVPDWIKGCEREGRIVGVRAYYLDADPRFRQVGPGVLQQHQQLGQNSAGQSQQSVPLTSPRTEVTPPTPEQPKAQLAERPMGTQEQDRAQGQQRREESDNETSSSVPEQAPLPLEHRLEQKVIAEEPKTRTEDMKPHPPSAEKGAENNDSEDEEESEQQSPSTENPNNFDDIQL